MNGGHLGVILGSAISALLLVAVALWVRRHDRTYPSRGNGYPWGGMRR